jgi:hypothetical protein
MKLGWLLLVIVGSTACGVNIRPSMPSADIDTLDFVIGDAATWPRRGTQLQNQLVDRVKQEVCWVKYARADMFECWRWDDRWIYHEVDHAIDGGSGASYAFSDARWLPRRITSERAWNLDVRRNVVLWWTPACAVDTLRGRAFPYRQRAWLAPARYISADLGTRDILVLEYEPYDPAGGPTHPERFEFARGAGWFAWASDRGRVTFDRIGGPAVARSAMCTEAPRLAVPASAPPHVAGTKPTANAR